MKPDQRYGAQGWSDRPLLSPCGRHGTLWFGGAEPGAGVGGCCFSPRCHSGSLGQKAPAWGGKVLLYTHIYVSPLCFRSFSHMSHFRILSRVPCAIQQVLISYLFYVQQYDRATSLSLFTFTHWRRKWQPTPVFLPGGSQRRGSLVGCHLWGHIESDTTEAT